MTPEQKAGQYAHDNEFEGKMFANLHPKTIAFQSFLDGYSEAGASFRESLGKEMRWVKCSERMPKTGETEIVFKDFEGTKSIWDVSLNDDEKIRATQFEWLDESPMKSEGAEERGYKYLIEDKRTGKWLTLGEMWRSDKLQESEDSRWTDDPNAAIKWNTREEAEEHNRRFFNMTDIDVTEHEFVSPAPITEK